MAVLTRADNPIVWQELSHQERSASRFTRRWWLLGPLMVVLMISLTTLTLTQVDYSTRELGIYMIWFVQVAVVTRSLVGGANAISREHVSLTWDALVLTGVSARQILFGKWRAVLRRISPWMLMLGIIRLAMIPIFFMALINYFAVLYIQYGYYYQDEPMVIAWVPWAAVLAPLMTVVLTVLEVLACTALGLAASAVLRRGYPAMLAAILIRFTPVVLSAAFTRYELGSESSSSYRVLRFAPFAVADSGTAPLSRLSVPYTPMSYLTHADALSGLFMATLVLVVLLVVSLLIAWWAIRRSGALPHQRAVVAAEPQ